MSACTQDSSPVILALETATTCGSLALVAERRCLAEYSLNTTLAHSKNLLTGINRLLEQTGTGWPQIGAVAVSLGPGSFTGLRVALATAKGLCLAADKPLLGVSSLYGLAGQFPFSPLPVCPVIDARKKEIYTALYRSLPGGDLEELLPPMAIRPESLPDLLDGPTILTGDALAPYGPLFKKILGDQALLAPPEIFFARAATIGLAAWRLFRAGEFIDPAGAVPLYVRASDAELHLGNPCRTRV